MNGSNLMRLAFSLVALAATSAYGQSGSRVGGIAQRRAVPGQSEQTPGERPLLALGGFDAVALHAGTVVAGQPQISSTFDSQIYRFAGEDAKKAFDASPAKYAPVMSGWSVVGWAEKRELKPGVATQAVVHGGRTYVFESAADKKAFLAASKKYADADLLLGGKSPVALVDEQKITSGKPEFEGIVEGWRVRFASAAEKEKFFANLGKYYPTLAGADPVAFLQGAVAMGDPKYSILYKERLYLTSTPENEEKFRGDPKPYSDLDVADGGACPVTKVEDGRLQLGKYKISTIHLGRRLLFASEAYRLKFLADPLKYLSAEKKAGVSP